MKGEGDSVRPGPVLFIQQRLTITGHCWIKSDKGLLSRNFPEPFMRRLGDNLSVRNERKGGSKRPLYPCFWHLVGGRKVAVQEDGESAKRICQWDKFSSGQINNSIGQGGKSSGRCRSNPMTL